MMPNEGRRTKDEGRPSFVWVLFFLATLTGCDIHGGTPATSVSGELSAEQDFTLKSIRGEDVSLSGLRSKNKAVLIDFWATWCTYCVEGMPELIRLQEKYGGSGLTVVGINVGESASQAAEFAEKMKLNFPVLLDGDMAVSRRFGLVGIPYTLLIAPDGKILGEYYGMTPKLVSDIEKSLA